MDQGPRAGPKYLDIDRWLADGAGRGGTTLGLVYAQCHSA